MRYYHTNVLIVEYPTKFLGTETMGRQKFKVAWTDSMRATEKESNNFQIIETGQQIGRNKYARKTTILVAYNIPLEQFVDAVSRYFSEKLNVKPYDLKLSFEQFEPFFNVKEVTP